MDKQVIQMRLEFSKLYSAEMQVKPLNHNTTKGVSFEVR